MPDNRELAFSPSSFSQASQDLHATYIATFGCFFLLLCMFAISALLADEFFFFFGDRFEQPSFQICPGDQSRLTSHVFFFFCDIYM